MIELPDITKCRISGSQNVRPNEKYKFMIRRVIHSMYIPDHKNS